MLRKDVLIPSNTSAPQRCCCKKHTVCLSVSFKAILEINVDCQVGLRGNIPSLNASEHFVPHGDSSANKDKKLGTHQKT